ncbi:MAG: serine/threonine protein kinase [Calditrichaeota bacterium]|nr:MAG: serine/threonine protein kinase [Calditrichota bacterium]MBL1206299.1 serine/threonine protein kinase [Calditrichota bacterium]NOG46125.1 serine/threonine protein kinase [Calditrichota bacterium]
MQNDEKLGSYKISGKIGEGGMAEIYKAYQPALKRHVVIKKLKDPNREIIARFKKEALLSASFSQENVVAIYDFLYMNRAYYLVMEYVDGEDLRALIDCSAPMSTSLAAMIILELAHGLEYTHNQSIIHRDIKPSNVLISKEGNVKLIDFGVAKDDTNVRLTMTGLIVGTPSYMSPEQAHGDPLGPQSDLYALGILLYEMLTGIKPFYGQNNTEILAKVVRSKYTPPHRINPEISLRLRRVIKKLLKKDMRSRYKNAAALIHDLEKCVSWQTRSRKKELFARVLDNMDKTAITHSDDTLKAAILENTSSWGWNALRYSLVAALLISGWAIFKQFSKKELGYIKVENPVKKMELVIDNKKVKPVLSRSALLGPFLKGGHYLQASDPASNSTFVAKTTVNANDTTLIKVELPKNHTLALLNISIEPTIAELLIDGFVASPDENNTIQLKAGWHEIEIRKTGYEPIKDKRFFRAAETYIMEYKLTKK